MPNLAGDPYAGTRSRPPPGDVNTGVVLYANTGVVLYAFDLFVRRCKFNAAIGDRGDAGVAEWVAEGGADTAGDGM